MKKLITAAIAVLCVSLTLGACDTNGQENQTEASTSKMTTTNTTPTTEAPTTETEEATSPATTEPTTTEASTQGASSEATETEEATTPTTEMPTEPSDDTPPEVEDGFQYPQEPGEAIEGIRAAELVLTVGDFLNDHPYEEGITRTNTHTELLDVEAKRIDGIYYLRAYPVTYAPIHDDGQYFVGIMKVSDRGIGYYTLLGEDEEVKAYHLRKREGLPPSYFRLEESASGKLHVTGQSIGDTDWNLVNSYDEFPLPEEGAYKIVYTTSGWNLNLRDKPSKDGERIEGYPVGTKFYVIDFGAPEFVLCVPPDGKHFGFASGAFLYDEDNLPTPTPAPSEAETEAKTEGTEPSTASATEATTPTEAPDA